jgi:hypothetical protein
MGQILLYHHKALYCVLMRLCDVRKCPSSGNFVLPANIWADRRRSYTELIAIIVLMYRELLSCTFIEYLFDTSVNDRIHVLT